MFGNQSVLQPYTRSDFVIARFGTLFRLSSKYYVGTSLCTGRIQFYTSKYLLSVHTEAITFRIPIFSLLRIINEKEDLRLRFVIGLGFRLCWIRFMVRDYPIRFRRLVFLGS